MSPVSTKHSTGLSTTNSDILLSYPEKKRGYLLRLTPEQEALVKRARRKWLRQGNTERSETVLGSDGWGRIPGAQSDPIIFVDDEDGEEGVEG